MFKGCVPTMPRKDTRSNVMPIPDAVLPAEPETEVKQNLPPSIDEIYDACNASLRCGCECPKVNRTESDCAGCGNDDCVNAFNDLERNWKKLP